jgi:hypothetical protein
MRKCQVDGQQENVFIRHSHPYNVREMYDV